MFNINDFFAFYKHIYLKQKMLINFQKRDVFVANKPLRLSISSHRSRFNIRCLSTNI